MGPGIGCYPIDPGEAGSQVTENDQKPLGLYHQAVGILKENRTHAGRCPVKGTVEGSAIHRFPGVCYAFDIMGIEFATLGGTLPYRLHIVMYPVDIFQDMIHWAKRELSSLIDGTERAAVPGTITGYTDQQAARFAGRPDRPLFKTEVWFWWFRGSAHSFSSNLFKLFSSAGCRIPDRLNGRTVQIIRPKMQRYNAGESVHFRTL
jgi:hypothetical protein